MEINLKKETKFITDSMTCLGIDLLWNVASSSNQDLSAIIDKTRHCFYSHVMCAAIPQKLLKNSKKRCDKELIVTT